MIKRPDCQLVGYDHRKESATWKEPRCDSQSSGRRDALDLTEFNGMNG